MCVSGNVTNEYRVEAKGNARGGCLCLCSSAIFLFLTGKIQILKNNYYYRHIKPFSILLFIFFLIRMLLFCDFILFYKECCCGCRYCKFLFPFTSWWGANGFLKCKYRFICY